MCLPGRVVPVRRRAASEGMGAAVGIVPMRKTAATCGARQDFNRPASCGTRRTDPPQTRGRRPWGTISRGRDRPLHAAASGRAAGRPDTHNILPRLSVPNPAHDMPGPGDGEVSRGSNPTKRKIRAATPVQLRSAALVPQPTSSLSGPIGPWNRMLQSSSRSLRWRPEARNPVRPSLTAFPTRATPEGSVPMNPVPFGRPSRTARGDKTRPHGCEGGVVTGPQSCRRSFRPS